jgi:hypothetical protein
MKLRSVTCRNLIAAASLASVAFLSACGSDGTGVPNLAKYEASRQPYYYVGRSFDGLSLSKVQPYQAGIASIFYGTCKPPPDGGCPAPLELQHRLCRGRLTVVIYVGANPEAGRARRAAHALRPLSEGARRGKPLVALDRAPAC